METLKQLSAKRKKASKILAIIDCKIDDLKEKKLIPKLKKKYEGKYWKYNNGTSNEERWWLYSFCRTVVSDWRALTDSFEMTTANNDERVFIHNKEQSFHLFQTEITKEEYMNQLQIFLNELKKLAS